MITAEQKKVIKQALSEYENVEDMLQYLERTFDLKNCKPGFMKTQLVDYLIKAIESLNPKLK